MNPKPKNKALSHTTSRTLFSIWISAYSNQTTNGSLNRQLINCHYSSASQSAIVALSALKSIPKSAFNNRALSSLVVTADYATSTLQEAGSVSLHTNKAKYARTLHVVLNMCTRCKHECDRVMKLKWKLSTPQQCSGTSRNT